MRHLDLFSGIGGFSLAAQTVWGGSWRSAGFCDNEPFSQAIIKKHWPKAKIYDDIKALKGSDIGPADLVTGGFPCQPFSSAGKRAGKEDDRHLWPHMLRVIREVHPRWVVGENVGGLLTWNGGMVLDEVYAGLEASGYEVWAFVIPACAVGAPHRRDRVWIIAHSDGSADRRGTGGDARSRASERLQERHAVGKPRESGPLWDVADTASPRFSQRKQGGFGKDESSHRAKKDNRSQRLYSGHASYSADEGLQGCWEKGQRFCRLAYRDGDKERARWNKDWLAIAARLCAVDDGVSKKLAKPPGWRNAALKGAGNAIVPQVAMQIFRFIKLIDEENERHILGNAGKRTRKRTPEA